MMISLPSQISRWPRMSDFGQVRLMNICANQSKTWRILWSGGLLTVIFTRTFIAWLWTISASLVNKIFIGIAPLLTLLPIATSTTVEHAFSQGCQLLSFTRNRLSASTIHSFLCLGAWGRQDLVFFEDVLAAVRGNSKRKREESHSDIEIIE